MQCRGGERARLKSQARLLPVVMACALGAGCVDRITAPIFEDAGPDDLVIAAVASGSGEILQVETFLAGEPPPSLSRPSGAEAHFLLIRDGDLRTLDGESFSSGLLSRLRVYDPKRAEATGYGACGRCGGSTYSPPQVVQDGDLCALPRFAEHAGDGEPEVIVSRLRIGLSGPCACSKYRADPGGAAPQLRADGRSLLLAARAGGGHLLGHPRTLR